MTIVDPFSSEKVVGDDIVLEPFEIIPSTALDDDPTTISSGEILVPEGDAELVVLLAAAATLSPTSVVWSFAISYDGTNFFTIDGMSADDWSPITVVEASMPDSRAVMKGRIVAPFFKVTATGIDTDAGNIVTVSASITRKPQSL